MPNTFASLEYRRALTQHASVVGLVIALHDTLIGDLRRAAQAMEKNDIETRCAQLVHGFQILTQLEAMLDMKNGGPAAINIQRFYRHVRGEMLAAQFKLQPAILYKLMKIVLEVREAWQQVEDRGFSIKPSAATSYVSPETPSAVATTPVPHVAFSCSC
jgi:flagellar protein FliS